MPTTETIEAKPNKLAVIAQEAQLSTGHAAEILADFGPLALELDDLFREADKIVVTDASQCDEMEHAHDVRMKIVKKRTSADKLRKKHKEIYKRGSEAVDDIAHAVMDPCELVEAKLENAEKFALRLQAQRKLELKAAREAIIRPYGFEFFGDLGELTQDQFNALHQQYISLKKANEDKAAKEEAERVATETARLAEEAKIREENVRLQKEAEAREAAAAAERARHEAEMKEVEDRARIEREVAEDAAKKERKALELKAAQERREAAEAARVAAESQRKEREAREKAEAELADRNAAEEKKRKVELAAKKKLEIAPDRIRVGHLQQQVRAINVPSVKSPEADRVCREVSDKLDAISDYIQNWLDEESAK